MQGGWGDYDSWQGTIPWWGLANALAVWFVLLPDPPHDDVEWVYRYLWPACAAGLVGVSLGVGGKAVPLSMIAFSGVACAPLLIQHRYMLVLVAIIAVDVCIPAFSDDPASTYSDVSTYIQMVTSACVGALWLLHSGQQRAQSTGNSVETMATQERQLAQERQLLF